MDTLFREIQKEDDAAVEQVIRTCMIEFGGDHEGTAWCYLETLENMTAAQRFYEKNGFMRIDEPVIDTGHFHCDVRYIKELK